MLQDGKKGCESLPSSYVGGGTINGIEMELQSTVQTVVIGALQMNNP